MLMQIFSIINTMFRLIKGSKCVINVVSVKIVILLQNMWFLYRQEGNLNNYDVRAKPCLTCVCSIN